MGANGSVASPSRLSNAAAETKPSLGAGASGFAPIRYGAVTRNQPPPLAALPDDTAGLEPELYIVDKGYEFPNTAGIRLGQNPVQYNPMLSRVVEGGKPAQPLTAGPKRYPNASWRLEFRQWAQRFPRGPAAPGRGRLAYDNPYYPGNMPSQVVGQATTGGAVAGQGTIQRSISPAFVAKGGRGMRKPYFARQTRLAPAISYSSTTDLVGASVFTEGPLGTGGVSGG